MARKDLMKYEKGTKLTRKRYAFCQEYIIDYNATAAAKRAGYSVRTANETAAALMTIPEIQRVITELEAANRERRTVTVDKVIDEYGKLAFSNFSAIVGYNDGILSLKDFDKLTDEQRACIKKFKIKTGRPVKDNPSIIPCDYVEIELHDKQHALDMLGKHFGMFKEQVDLTVETVPKLEIIRK